MINYKLNAIIHSTNINALRKPEYDKKKKVLEMFLTQHSYSRHITT